MFKKKYQQDGRDYERERVTLWSPVKIFVHRFCQRTYRGESDGKKKKIGKERRRAEKELGENVIFIVQISISAVVRFSRGGG